jgi:hypothetical protein
MSPKRRRDAAANPKSVRRRSEAKTASRTSMYRRGSEPPLPSWWPVPIVFLALACAVGGYLTAPEIPAAGPPEWFAPFFAAAAATIAALFIALALGTIQASARPVAAIVTVSYTGLGEVAALAGLSTALPHSLYKFLLAATIGAGIGALASAIVIGARAISNDAWRRREDNLEEILNRGLGERRGESQDGQT